MASETLVDCSLGTLVTASDDVKFSGNDVGDKGFFRLAVGAVVSIECIDESELVGYVQRRQRQLGDGTATPGDDHGGGVWAGTGEPEEDLRTMPVRFDEQNFDGADIMFGDDGVVDVSWVDPCITIHVAASLRDQYAISKGRQKAREERRLGPGRPAVPPTGKRADGGRGDAYGGGKGDKDKEGG